jgi:hypothetical protein
MDDKQFRIFWISKAFGHGLPLNGNKNNEEKQHRQSL